MSIVNDPIIEKIKTLYDLGPGGQYEIVRRTIFVITAALEMGKSGKECIDNMMDKGIKPLELGLSMAVALSRINPSKLSGIDSALRIKIMGQSKDLLEDWAELEKQNE
jgi:hypothetical protein